MWKMALTILRRLSFLLEIMTASAKSLTRNRRYPQPLVSAKGFEARAKVRALGIAPASGEQSLQPRLVPNSLLIGENLSKGSLIPSVINVKTAGFVLMEK